MRYDVGYYNYTACEYQNILVDAHDKYEAKAIAWAVTEPHSEFCPDEYFVSEHVTEPVVTKTVAVEYLRGALGNEKVVEFENAVEAAKSADGEINNEILEEDGTQNNADTIEIGKLLERKIGKRDYVFTVDEAKKRLENGTFDDCDGSVYYCTDTHVSCVEVKNYWDIVEGNHRPEFTKIIIYGK